MTGATRQIQWYHFFRDLLISSREIAENRVQRDVNVTTQNHASGLFSAFAWPLPLLRMQNHVHFILDRLRKDLKESLKKKLSNMEDIEVKRSKVEHFKIKQRSPRFSAFLLDSNLSNAETIVMKSIRIKQRKNTLEHLKIFWLSWKI